ncbi:hypothetical protein [Neisseria iguanae]|uniref:hypothetical protein n=1 Tax=Neisseria iguanae TaxID=90242 RepID=UPI0011B2136D|nr:hypothetical protein [Neisseria iguanae]
MPSETFQTALLYVAFIESVYQGALLPVSASKITQCSKGMAVTHAVYSVFYGKGPTTIPSVLKQLGKAGANTLKSWIKTVSSDRRYKSCISGVALNWRSPLQMALMDI